SRLGHLPQRRRGAAGRRRRLIRGGPLVQPPPVPGDDMRARGAAVEAAAGRHLAEAGLRPVATNATARFGELDLVMLDGPTLVFVEVRYRRSDRFGGGAASVDARKRRR